MPRRTERNLVVPEARAAFASRLRERRVQSGYARARNFAKALGIEENRYTRYERGEPDVTLIQKICEALRITPDELFGYEGPAMRELKRAIWTERLRDNGNQLQQQLTGVHMSVGECLELVSKLTSLMRVMVWGRRPFAGTVVQETACSAQCFQRRPT